LEDVRELHRTQIFYEAPHRIIETLKDIVEVMGPARHIVVAREVTKLHEEFLRGRVENVLNTAEERGELKGEITLLIGRAEESEAAPAKESVGEMVKRLTMEESLQEKDALKRVAKELGIGKSEAYREWQRTKK
jgi:16S rRNA (cytidine1402-2'-O)-methyltransferase